MAGINKLTLVGIDPDGLVRVLTEGNLSGADTRATGANLFESLLGANWAASRVALDLGRTGYLDSAAIGWLIESHKQFKSRGGILLLHSVAPRVRQMLELLRLDQMLYLLPDEAAARSFLRDHGTISGSAQSGQAGHTPTGRPGAPRNSPAPDANPTDQTENQP